MINYIRIKIGKKITELDNLKNNDKNWLKIKDLMKMGDISVDLKDYGLAIKKYSHIIELDSSNLRALFNLGVIYAKIGVNKKAIKYWKQCSEINPEFLDVWFNLGIIYYGLEKFNDAIICFQEVNPIKDKSIIIKPYKKTFKISEELILKICGLICNIIITQNLSKNFEQGISSDVINEIKKKIVNWFKEKKLYQRFPIDKKGFNEFLEKSIEDLTIIVYNFIKYHKKEEVVDMKEFAMILSKKKANLNYSLSTLRSQILPPIFNYLSLEFQDLNLEKKNKRYLKKDKYGKVCGRCGLRKPLFNFQKISDGTLSSSCKECTLKYIEILKFRKKLKLLFELHQGKFNGKCWNPDCSTNFLKLPSISFHHPHKKNYTWKKLKNRSYSIIKERFEKDGVIPLCNNCHEPYQQTILKNYKKLILNPYLFIKKSGKRRTAKEINDMIDKAILNNPELDKKLKKKLSIEVMLNL